MLVCRLPYRAAMKTEYDQRPWWPLYLLYTLLAFCVLRFGFSSTGLSMHWRPDYDANIYHIIGRGWMQGIMPYTQLSDLKGPLVFFQGGLGSVLSPDSFLGASLLQAPVVGLGMLYACKSATLFVGRSWGMVISSLLFVYGWYFGLNPSATVLTLQFISLYHVLACVVNGGRLSRSAVFLMGAFVGMVLLIKFNLAAFWIPIGIYALACKERARNAALMLAGLALAVLPVCVLLAREGILIACWQEYILTAVQYGSVGVENSALWQRGWELLAEMLPEHLHKVGCPVLKATCGAMQLFLWLMLPRVVRMQQVRAYYTVLGGGFLCCAVAILGGEYHFFHYYFSFLPYVLLSLVWGVCLLQRRGYIPQRSRFASMLGILMPMLLTLFAAGIAVHIHAYRPHNGVGAICRSSQSLVKLIQGSSFLCTDTTACLHLYRLTGTTPPIRHFTPQMIPLGRQKHRQEMLDYMRNHHVRYLVCTMQTKKDTEDLITQSGIPYRRVSLLPQDFPPYPPLTAFTPFCLYERD